MKGDCIARLIGSSRHSRLGHGAPTSNHIGAKGIGHAIDCRSRRAAPEPPAGHHTSNIPQQAPPAKLPISPLAGEMPGRAEGGTVPPTCQPIIATPSGCFRLGMG
ncbi:MAG: hypothetical protein EOQ95_32130 [Mesorhizobium sp.]|nr:MAG: hypothetical protein EOQ95_32130 [Mesorhizobium sp.]TIM08200.1 MAG: hypothetical protein E5Y62_15720 [Mesorhizobium sp.]